MPKLLLVDDDLDLCTIIADCLEGQGHDLDIAGTGRAAQQFLKTGRYDLLVLDWDLPDIEGIEICKDLRAAGDTTPVLMLTGHTAVDAKEEGFDAGADDYLTKPFQMKELLARLRALLRRAAISAASAAQQANTVATELRVGCLLDGKYRLDELIGQGGMAIIYRATHIGMDKPVVVKLVQASLLGEDKMLERFQQECRATARINHANVVAAFDSGLAYGGQPYLVLEYIKGETLSSYIKREAPLPVDLTVEILIQVCHGLEQAHRAGIIHRDLKPSNILLQAERKEGGWVKVVDFGLALLAESVKRFTRTDVLMGSAGYISPEQLRDLPLDERVDIYALGVILFEMLTKHLPFRAGNTGAFLVKQLLEAPELLSDCRLDIEPGSPLELILAKALAADRNVRYQTVLDLRQELERLR